MNQNHFNEIVNLKPKLVWEYFCQLSEIPRPSGQEYQVTEWLIKIAVLHNLDYKIDKVGNFCLKVPASKGFEKSPTVIFQAHSDMVTEKRFSKVHDFMKDPLKLILKDGWLKAEDTTLGADNGIGLCLALAVATDDSVLHPALEILVTIEEETTFKGATNVDVQALEMSGTYYINLDSEEVDTICISSAGMSKLTACTDLNRVSKFDDEKSYIQLSVENLPGGHSGCQIHDVNRENAIIALLEAVNNIDCNLISMNGGNKDNAIPRYAHAIIEVTAETLFQLTKATLKTQKNYPIQLSTISVEELNLHSLTSEDTQLLLTSLLSLRNGVLAMHKQIPGLVESSSNFAYINTDPNTGEISLRISFRSSDTPYMQEIFKHHRVNLNLANFSVQSERNTPGWSAQTDSDLVKKAEQAYMNITGQKPSISAVHAGLEVGEITAKISQYLQTEVQAISIGPTIVDPHTPDEKVEVQTVETTYLQVLEILKSFKV